jgi:eukaryotic-like serine/threonine-protein kinase
LEAERYARVKALFGAVAELPPPQREALFAAEDADVVAEVRLLLREEQLTTQHMGRPILDMLDDIAGDECEPGDVLGAWTLVRRIGHGGMGNVFLAQRSDGHFEHTAAVKLLRGIPSSDALAYLARERQILARLNHPNIARLLDGGATPRGQPYLVIDHVDGVPVDEYCARHALAPAAILRLMADVCAAVGFAHQRLIVHCDIKPSNILVDAQGRPVLLDFGIAQLLQHDGATAEPSAEPARAFTPDYASPEQREGGTVSTTSDVYGIGRTLLALLDAAAERQPRRGDAELAALIARATAADPAQRYPGVDALAQDITRYLVREPLQAMRGGGAYRARKFLQRRWPWVATALAFCLMVAGFTLRVIADRDRAEQAEREALADRDRAAQAERNARAERDRAVQAQQTARQISAFLTSVLNGAHPDAGSGEVPTSKLVEQALARIDSELAGQPAAQAELYATLAGVERVLRNAALARATFDRAVALERQLYRPLQLAAVLSQRAQLLKAEFGKPEAEADAREAYELVQARVPADSPALADAAQLLGVVLSERGNFDAATPLLLRALEIHSAADPQGDEAITSLDKLAVHSQARQDYPAAIGYFQRELALRAARHGTNNVDYYANLEGLGAAYGRARRFDEAEQALRTALQGLRRLDPADSAEMAWRYTQLGRVLDNAGRSRDALPLYQQALAMGEKKMGKDSISYAVLLANIALAQRRVGDYAAAERAYAQAMPMFRKTWPAEDRVLCRVMTDYGILLLRNRKPDAARELLLAAWRGRLAAQGENADDTALSRIALAELERRSGRPDRAVEHLKAAEAALPRLGGVERADYLREHGHLQLLRGDRAAAIRDFEAAERAIHEALGDNDPRTWLARLDRAEVLTGDPKTRRAGAALAVQIRERVQQALVVGSPVMAQIERAAALR